MKDKEDILDWNFDYFTKTLETMICSV